MDGVGCSSSPFFGTTLSAAGLNVLMGASIRQYLARFTKSVHSKVWVSAAGSSRFKEARSFAALHTGLTPGFDWASM